MHLAIIQTNTGFYQFETNWSPMDSLTKASDVELLCSLWSTPEEILMPVIWDPVTLIMTSL